MRKCSKCGELTKNKGYCNKCSREYLKSRYDSKKKNKYYIEHREAALERSRKQRNNNPERMKEYQKAYRMLGIDDSLMIEYKLRYGKDKE